MKHDERLVWLDLIRGLSAIAVCAGHLRAAMFVDYAQLPSSTLVQKLFYFLTGLGHQAVIVFFVLSGFLVGGSILKSGANFSGTNYMIVRLTRLWVVLIPALLLTASVDQVLAAWYPEVLSGQYYALWSFGPAAGHFSGSLSTFLGNVFFLQTITVPVFGTNGPLWSLANEFWYYLLFPVCLLAIGRCGSVRKDVYRVLMGMLALVVFIWLPAGFRLGYLIWVLGALIWLFCSKNVLKSSYKALALGGAFFVGALLFSRSTFFQNPSQTASDVSDVIIAVGFSSFVVALMSFSPLPAPRLLLSRLSYGISKISYSLYVIHFPLVILIGVSFYRSEQLIPGPLGFVYFGGWLAMLLAVAMGFWWIFEKRTPVVKALISSRLMLRPNNQPQSE